MCVECVCVCACVCACVQCVCRVCVCVCVERVCVCVCVWNTKILLNAMHIKMTDYVVREHVSTETC